MSTWRAMPWAVRGFVLLQVASFAPLWGDLLWQVINAIWIGYTFRFLPDPVLRIEGLVAARDTISSLVYGVLVFRVAWLRGTSARLALVVLFAFSWLQLVISVAGSVRLGARAEDFPGLGLYVLGLMLEGFSYLFIFSRGATRWFARHDLAEKVFE